MKPKERLQSERPSTMTGTLSSRILRRPTRSMAWKAAMVKAKFVHAMERDVRVGEAKPQRLKIVAEKYIRAFYVPELAVAEEMSLGRMEEAKDGACKKIDFGAERTVEVREKEGKKGKLTKPQSC